jgi:hypothetical protein
MYNIAQTLFKQLGGTSLTGAIVMTGGTNVVLGEDNLNIPRSVVDEAGLLSCQNGVRWNPNVRSHKVKFLVILQPNDTYSVFIWKGFNTSKVVRTGKVGEVVARADDVYFDQLIDIVDQLYLNFLTDHEDGFIPF